MAEDADNKREDGSPPKPDPPGYFEGESMTRRTALTRTAAALGGVAGLAVVLPAVGFSLAPVLDEEEAIWQPVGDVGDFNAQTYKPVIITLVEDIGETGKGIAYVRRGSTDLGESPDEFIAVSNRCAHAGCPTRFVEAAGNFICPCHGGVYDFQGKVIGGPPVRPLDRFQTRVEDGQLVVGPRYSVTSQLDAVRTRDPGEFTGGIWNYIYPPRPSVPPPP